MFQRPQRFYPLLGPSGTSLTLVDDQGSQAAYLLYDAYGDILTQVISSTVLTSALATTGDLADPGTGLVHLGGGRFYDPGLGRPLQPNPVHNFIVTSSGLARSNYRSVYNFNLYFRYRRMITLVSRKMDVFTPKTQYLGGNSNGTHHIQANFER